MNAGYPFVPRISIDGIAWPAVPSGAASVVFGLLDQFGQSQWWPPDLIRSFQSRQLAVLLDHAARHIPFYASRLAEAGYRAGEGISAELWRRIPVLTRRNVQEAGRQLDSPAVPPEHGPSQLFQTSGSTGTPIAVHRTQMAYLFWQAVTLREHLWHERDIGAKLAVIRFDPEGHAKPPDGRLVPNWGEPTAPYYPTGPMAMLSITSTIDEQTEWLRRHDPAYLLTHPTNLLALARHCRAMGVRLALRGATTIGEPLTDETRTAVHDAFGVTVTDIYSTRECGYLALQCPAATHYHVQAEDVCVEVLDDDGAPCPPGATGRVVVTPLHNFATPLIRYEVGDLAEVGGPCKCGRGLPVITRIAGRTRNMVRLRSGGLRYPGYIFSKLVEVPAVVQFQAVQRAYDRIDLDLVVRRPLTAAEEEQIRTMIEKAIGGDLAVTIGYRDAIPRAAGGKYEEFRCEIPT